ncbi:MAG: type II secretion system F family protein [Pseudohongiellaceae bacterium]
MDFSIYLIGLLVFLAGFLFLWAVYLFSLEINQARGEQVKRRIKSLKSVGTTRDGTGLSLALTNSASAADQLLLVFSPFRRLGRFVEQAGFHYGPSGAIWRGLVAGASGAAAAALIGTEISTLLLGCLAACGLWCFYLSRGYFRRRDRLIRQLPDAMDFFARSLRAGNPFTGALKAAPEEMPQPIAREMEITFEEINYGLDFEEVMRNLAARVDAQEIRFFVTAVLVQKKTGGNLAEILNRIAALLRERIRAQGDVRIQAAEMKASAHVLIALPFLVGGMLHLSNPEYFPVLFQTTLGRSVVYAQLALMLFGYLVMKRMVNFRI